IVDGHHLPAATVKSMVRVKSARRTILVTDAIAAAGRGPGRHRLGEIEVLVGPDGRASLPGGPYLAGSGLTMAEAISKAVSFDEIPVEDAIAMASTQPAEYLGIETAGTVAAAWDPAIRHLEIEAVVP